MSNEYKDWLNDRMKEVVIEAGIMDKTTGVEFSPIGSHRIIYGIKNGEAVAFAVWWDSIEKEWRYERRELNA